VNRRVEHVMGMPIVADIRDDGDHTRALDAVFDWFRWVDDLFSTYKPDSAISRINRGELALSDAHSDVVSVVGRCEQLRATTDGYFDVRYDGTLDPSGLVKGWAVDRGAAVLESAGVGAFALNAGGDMRLRGSGWRIGIQHPTEPGAVAKVLELSDTAVATSGLYARGDHIVDPRTGETPRDVLSVTIIGSDLATADAYATAAFAMGGRRALHWTARLRGFEAMTILADGRVLTTPGFPA
jgi:thiamine biosynthesis lipoprotein